MLALLVHLWEKKFSWNVAATYSRGPYRGGKNSITALRAFSSEIGYNLPAAAQPNVQRALSGYHKQRGGATEVPNLASALTTRGAGFLSKSMKV